MQILDKILWAGAGLIAMTLAAPAAAQANLVATINPNSGMVSVQNIGGQMAGASVVTVLCQGNCPEPPAAAVAPYLNPAFPNMLAIDVPALPPFGTFNHSISFWHTIIFPKGRFQLRVCADAGTDVAESNERDNCSFSPHIPGQDLKGPKKFKTKTKKKRLKLKAN